MRALVQPLNNRQMPLLAEKVDRRVVVVSPKQILLQRRQDLLHCCTVPMLSDIVLNNKQNRLARDMVAHTRLNDQIQPSTVRTAAQKIHKLTLADGILAQQLPSHLV